MQAAGYTLPVVLTQPDRPHGRGLKLVPSPVKAAALAAGLPVLQPATLRTAEAQGALSAIPLDVLVVAAYGLILPPAVLAWPRHGCLNIHASRLPRWRGAAPIARAIEAGDAVTGITIMQMDAGLDTGPMVAVEDVPIDPRDTAGRLHDRLAPVGARLLLDVLGRLEADGALAATPQPSEGVTYAAKIGRGEAAVDWTAEAVVLDRRIRAFDPAPGAFATLGGEVVKIVRAEPVVAPGGGTAPPGPGDSALPPGEVIAVGPAGIDVACGRGVLRLAEVKPAGGRAMAAGAFARGRNLAPGASFDVPPAARGTR
jgi:methionyl-tRNA formyltransferase